MRKFMYLANLYAFSKSRKTFPWKFLLGGFLMIFLFLTLTVVGVGWAAWKASSYAWSHINIESHLTNEDIKKHAQSFEASSCAVGVFKFAENPALFLRPLTVTWSDLKNSCLAPAPHNSEPSLDRALSPQQKETNHDSSYI